MKKRLLSIVPAMILLLSMIPVAFAAERKAVETVTVEGIIYRLRDTYAEVWGYEGEPTDIVFAAEVSGLPVTAIYDHVFEECASLRTIVIPESITTIGTSAFLNSGLTYVKIAKEVSDIGYRAFDGCTNLTAIDVEEGNDIYYSREGVLYGYHTYSYSGETVQLLYQVPGAYSGILTVPEGVEDIYDYYALTGCTGVTEVYLPATLNKFDHNHFRDCVNLTAIHMDDDNELFYDEDGVLYGPAVDYDDEGNEVYVPSILAVPAAYPGPDFSIPDGVELIGSHAFNNCANIEHLYIPASTADYYTQNFAGCDRLMGIWVDEGNPSYISDEYGVVYNRRRIYKEYDEATDSIVDVVYPEMTILDIFPTGLRGCYEVPEGVIRLAYDSFYYANIDALILPASLNRIIDFALSYCKNLNWLLFRGDIPYVGYNILSDVNATIHYPIDNESWADLEYVQDLFYSYPGTLIFVGYADGNEPVPPYDMIGAAAKNPFTDVADSEFYYEPVLWAVEKSITSGMTPTTFEPATTCTRGQVVTFLWRAAGCPEPKNMEHPFEDVTEDYYYKAMLWAVENGITNGMSATTFEPATTCTRGQVVTFLWRAAGKPAPGKTEHLFEDVTEDYYYDAMLWAVENSITNGMSTTTFEPATTCTRAQVVTFLYRAFAK